MVLLKFLRFRVSSIAFTIASIPGCAPSNAPSNTMLNKEASQPAVYAESKEQYPRLNWKSIDASGNEIRSTGSPILANVASFHIVEEKLRQLDWHNSDSQPTIAIERAQDQSLTIILSPDLTADHPQMIAVVREPGPKYGNATSARVRHSRPLNDLEHSLSLLRSYVQEDGDFESLVEWVDRSFGSSKKDE